VDENCDGVDEVCPPADNDGDGFTVGADCNDNNAAINPGATEVCGNGVDENCDGVDEVCPPDQFCTDGNGPVITEFEYNPGDEKLHIKGRAISGSSITINNPDTGQTLAEGILAREGKWEVEIRNVGSNLVRVRVVSSNGCVVDKDVNTGEDEHDRNRRNTRRERGYNRSHD
jgi:hypothetical protein